MSIKMKDVLDAIDHRARQIHEGEMGLWVRVSEWDLVRESMRHSLSEADSEMIHQDAIYREFLSRAYKQEWAVEFIEAAKRRSAPLEKE